MDLSTAGQPWGWAWVSVWCVCLCVRVWGGLLSERMPRQWGLLSVCVCVCVWGGEGVSWESTVCVHVYVCVCVWVCVHVREIGRAHV